MRFGVNVFEPDFVKCPQARHAQAFVAILEPGDLLYVPGSYLHAAINLQPGLGVSRNFVGFSNFPTFRDHVTSIDWEHERLLANGALWNLIQILQDTGYSPQLDSLPATISMRESDAHAKQLVAQHIASSQEAQERVLSSLAHLLWPTGTPIAKFVSPWGYPSL
jgi:ribosomal protein L16 Arg81 hydroxylase